jgi:hypothetical protein
MEVSVQLYLSALPSEKAPAVPTEKKAGWSGSHTSPGRLGKEKKSLPLLGIERRFLGFAAQSLFIMLSRQLSKWNRIPLEKLMFAQLFKKLPALNGS